MALSQQHSGREGGQWHYGSGRNTDDFPFNTPLSSRLFQVKTGAEMLEVLFSSFFITFPPSCLPLMGRRIHLLTIKSRRLFCWVSIGQYQCVCKVKCVWEAESERKETERDEKGADREARDDKSPGKLVQQETVAVWAQLRPVCQTKSRQTQLKGRFPSGWRATWNYPCLLNLSLHFTLIITSDPQEHLANCFSLFSFIMFNVTSRSCFMA